MGKKATLDRKRALRLRFRRQWRLQRRQVEALGAQAEQRLEDDFFKRLERLVHVRRFVGSWMLVVVLLIGCVVGETRGLSSYYQQLTAVPGGTYTEGIVGAFTNANPLYATDSVDATVARLIFAGLLTYDQHNQLTGDLAESWSANDAGTVYTVHLRPHLTWQDGVPLTSNDVLFTYQVIQNPDARSPLYASWQGIKVAAPDRRTITFTLPNPLASFPYSLTNGIVPKHLLGAVPMVDMRSSSFNTSRPVGAGPFQWQAIELTSGSADNREEHIALKPFADYHGGKPKLSRFVVRTFHAPDQLVKSFQKQEVTAAVGLAAMPKELQNDHSVDVYSLPLTAEVMTFFRTGSGVLSNTKVRQAMVMATDVPAVIGNLTYATIPVREPLLPGQLAYNDNYRQSSRDLAGANKLLQDDGWQRDKTGIRRKGADSLSFVLTVQDSGEYPAVAHRLAAQWRAVGATVKVLVEPDNATFQSDLAHHNYDAVLYGIAIGVDPDVYVYWHSSQADPRAATRLNLSEYRSATADGSLEAGRTRLDPALRAEKYKSFLQAWQADAPAVGLYQPRFLYLTHDAVFGLGSQAINSDTDRFSNVQNWEIRQVRK